MKLQFLLNNTYAANPKWCLVEKSILSQPEHIALADILADENIFGVFKPANKENNATAKIAYKDVALLFYFLQQPGTLPAFIKNNYDDETNAMIAKLVCEDILLIQTEEGFLSGTMATKWLFKQHNGKTEATSTLLTHLSNRAITYAIQLQQVDQAFISTALYTYNTLPVIPNEYIKDVERFLGIGFNTTLESELLQYWVKQTPTKEYNWIMWHRKKITDTNSRKEATYKLYVSSALDFFPEVFKKTALLLSSTKAKGFKTGADHQGMVRADRFVIYFSTYTDMMEAAYILVDALQAYPAQGVPFTAALDDKGIISWGIDPPSEEVIHALEGGSWRAGIAEKISTAIMQAKSNHLNKYAIFDFVQQKLVTEGIDPHTWTPQSSKENFNSLPLN